VAAAIKAQIAEFIAVLKERGEHAARNSLFTFLFHDQMAKAISDLFKQFAASYATRNYRRLIRLSKARRKDDGQLGSSDMWNQDIEDYLNQFILTRAVVPITETTKKQILKVLIEGEEQGWGVDRIIQELTNNEQDELTDFRARRIVRTELSIAANFADKMVQDKVPFEVDKIWISVHDSRTRDSHREMDGVEVQGDADFRVPIIKNRQQIGIDLMSGPGDPEASPGNIIFCRCTKALIPKRDKQGRLIPKTKIK
jgi:uncharacterized protein with gpF-like domain